MSQRRLRPSLLQENNYGTNYPAPAVKVVDMTTLNGGLNLWDLSYRMTANQSPDLLNVYWKDGCLSSRGGQEYIYTPSAEGTEDYGKAYACYDSPWQGYLIAHKGSSLYKINAETGEHTRIYDGTVTAVSGGTFFVFGDKLYYMNGHEYLVIDNTCSASAVEPYVPLVAVNRKPSGVGGSQYEDENRLSPKKRIQFTTDGTTVKYVLPSGYTPLDADAVLVTMSSPTEKTYYEKQTVATKSDLPAVGDVNIYFYVTDESKYYRWNAETKVYDAVTAPSDSTLFTVDRTAGTVTFNTAPEAASELSPSNLEMTISKADEDTQNSILGCTCVTVYGGDTQLAVVCGGTPKQPNAYFWSGTSEYGLDPTYFPFDYYNYAGAKATEYITGFGKQQSMLVIFKERSIGKTYFKTTTVDDAEYLKLSYTPVNDTIGCNLEGSIRLVQNNLVFANTYGGVYLLLDTTAYGENTVKRISRNVNGDGTLSGFLSDAKSVSATAVTSFDDRQRYWVSANGHVYLWDYTVSGTSKSESGMTWFLFDNMRPICWYHTDDDNYYLMQDGSVVKLIEGFVDFGQPISRRYTFATMNFGTYEVLKDVLRVVFATRSDTDSNIEITYYTDYESRKDQTPIAFQSWGLASRNLSRRSLTPIPYAKAAVRVPRCFHVRHFSMTLENNTANTDMSIISVQILYRLSREDR